MKKRTIIACVCAACIVAALALYILPASTPVGELAPPLSIYQPIADNVEMSVELKEGGLLQVTVISNWLYGEIYGSIVYNLEFFSRGNWYVFPKQRFFIYPATGRTFPPLVPHVSDFSLSAYYPLIVPGLYRVRLRVRDGRVDYPERIADRNVHDLVAEIYITKQDAINYGFSTEGT